MHEFDKCHFCASYDPTDDWCSDFFCDRASHSDYILDVRKVLKKAEDMGITVTDVLNLIRECNPKVKSKEENPKYERYFNYDD